MKPDLLRLIEAAKRARAVFSEYAQHHIDTGDICKAQRNAALSALLDIALHPFEKDKP